MVGFEDYRPLGFYANEQKSKAVLKDIMKWSMNEEKIYPMPEDKDVILPLKAENTHLF